MWIISTEYLGFLNKKIMMNIHVEYLHQISRMFKEKMMTNIHVEYFKT